MGSIARVEAGHTSEDARRVYLLTSPRTASNLFVRILNLKSQPNLRAGAFHAGYYFINAYLQRQNLDCWEKPLDQLTDEQKKTIADGYQSGVDEFRKHLESAQESNEIAFVKEHVQFLSKPTLFEEIIHGTPSDAIPEPWHNHWDESNNTYTPENPTFIPDNILQTFKPCFLIRHPALQFPSLIRARKDCDELGDSSGNSAAGQHAARKGINNFTTVHRLYDLYASHFQSIDPSGPLPLVIDAADFITNPADVMQHFCAYSGLDFSVCQFNWSTASEEQMKHMTKDVQRMLSTLNASSGIVKSKAQRDVSIDVEAEKWKEEFGEELAAELEGYVRAAMSDYEYLMSKRFDPLASTTQQQQQEQRHVNGLVRENVTEFTRRATDHRRVETS